MVFKVGGGMIYSFIVRREKNGRTLKMRRKIGLFPKRNKKEKSAQ
jgi:hypothetical protein